jgi:putative aldouronate transport system permease protein
MQDLHSEPRSLTPEQGAANVETKPKKARRFAPPANRMNTFPLHIMLIPTVILLFIYQYLPMVGTVIAFQDFDIYMGIQAFWKSRWVGLGNYEQLLAMGTPLRVLFNTINIAFWKILMHILVPVTVAILLNELTSSTLRRSVQTIIYIPHFVSWVILGGIIKQILMADGVVNQFIMALGGESIPFLQSNTWFVPTIIVTNIWKTFGFGTIVYLAAISGINPELYEAAIVDGATRWRQTIHITLPGMSIIIVLTTILALRRVLNAGFDQIFNLYNVLVYETGDIIDTFMFRMTFESDTPAYDLGAAVGLFRSFVSLIFIALSNYLAKRFAGYQVF